MTIRILLLEDSDLDAELITLHLRKGDIAHDVTRVATREDFVEALSDKYDLILADYSLPSFDGLTALTIAHERTPADGAFRPEGCLSGRQRLCGVLRVRSGRGLNGRRSPPSGKAQGFRTRRPVSPPSN